MSDPDDKTFFPKVTVGDVKRLPPSLLAIVGLMLGGGGGMGGMKAFFLGPLEDRIASLEAKNTELTALAKTAATDAIAHCDERVQWFQEQLAKEVRKNGNS
jgi:hypothetical protein